MLADKDTPFNDFMKSFSTFVSSITSSQNVSGRYTNFEVLRASAPEVVQVEFPHQIRRYYTSAPTIEVPVTPPRQVFPSNGSEVRRENFVLVSEVHDTVQSDFNPAKVDTTTLSFKETCNQLASCDLDKYGILVTDAILRYSLAISGFPYCPDEDLMLAVYFYFEEKFEIQANFELCVRFDNHDRKDQVGVLLDSILTKEEILRKVAGNKGSEIKITRNGSLHWILDGFCGH